MCSLHCEFINKGLKEDSKNCGYICVEYSEASYEDYNGSLDRYLIDVEVCNGYFTLPNELRNQNYATW